MQQHCDFKICVLQLFRLDGKCMLSPRIWERICRFCDFKQIGFHYTQLTPEEHLAWIQLPFVHRLELHAEARGCSRDKTDFWKHVVAGVDLSQDAVDGDEIVIEEGVDENMEMALDMEDADKPMFPVSLPECAEIVFRTERIEEESAKLNKPGRTSSLSKAMRQLQQYMNIMETFEPQQNVHASCRKLLHCRAMLHWKTCPRQGHIWKQFFTASLVRQVVTQTMLTIRTMRSPLIQQWPTI